MASRITAKLNPAKKRKRNEKQEHTQPSSSEEQKAAFYKLLEESTIRRFLERDKYKLMSDKYLLAMTLIYFQRAGLKLNEYKPVNFYCAIFLANQMEEDVFNPTANIPIDNFHQKKDTLWKRMQYRTFVSLKQLEEVMRDDQHWAWERHRNNRYGEAKRRYPGVPAKKQKI